MISEKLQTAVDLIKAGKINTAIIILEEIVEADPDNENAWLWLYYCAGDFDSKKKYLRRALEINPNNPQSQKAWEKLNNAPATIQSYGPKKQNSPIVKAILIILVIFSCRILLLASTMIPQAQPAISSPTLKPAQQPATLAKPSPARTATHAVAAQPTASPTPMATNTTLPQYMRLDSLNTLKSYRTKSKIIMKDPEGDPSTFFSWQISTAWVSKIGTKNIYITRDGNLYGLNDKQSPLYYGTDAGVIMMGRAWKYNYSNDTWSTDYDNKILDEPFVLLVSTKKWGQLNLIGKELVQNIQCQRYSVETNFLEFSILNRLGTSTYTTGEIWIANQEGMPFAIIKANLTIIFRNKTPFTPIITNNDEAQAIFQRGVYTYTYEVTDINDPTITVAQP